MLVKIRTRSTRPRAEVLLNDMGCAGNLVASRNAAHGQYSAGYSSGDYQPEDADCDDVDLRDHPIWLTVEFLNMLVSENHSIPLPKDLQDYFSDAYGGDPDPTSWIESYASGDEGVVTWER